MSSLSTATRLNCKRPIFSSLLTAMDVHFKKVGLTLLLLLGGRSRSVYNLSAHLQLTEVKHMVSISQLLNKHK